jgi:hypothetical protein
MTFAAKPRRKSVFRLSSSYLGIIYQLLSSGMAFGFLLICASASRHRPGVRKNKSDLRLKGIESFA